MKQVLLIIGVFCLIVLLSYVMWNLKRRVNYNLGYKSMVGEQIQKELKPVNARVNDLEMRLNDLQQRVK
jgi:uncharacterized protein YoxC